jgi:hypothetical protein
VAMRLENSECLCFSGSFSLGLSSLISSIITVQMIIFPASSPNSHRSLASNQILSWLENDLAGQWAWA